MLKVTTLNYGDLPQILTNVHWELTTATNVSYAHTHPMPTMATMLHTRAVLVPTAQIQKAASSVHVLKALQGMVFGALVCHTKPYVLTV